MDWTVEEEKAFAELMEVGNLERLGAIRLYRRMGCNLARALKYAKETGEDRKNYANRSRVRVKKGRPEAESAQAEKLSVIQGSA